MNPLARYLGLAGVACTLLLFVVDFVGHLDERPDRAPDPPPGFRHHLEGIGDVEVAFDGRVDLVADEPRDDGGEVVRVPRYRITGDDPRPVDGGMQLRDAVIRTAGGQSVGFVVHAPTAWIPLDERRKVLAFDLRRRWRLENPDIEIHDLFPDQVVTVATDAAEVDPATDHVTGRGPFTLTAGDMQVTGSALELDPRTRRVDFAPHEGAVAWDVGGARASGFSGEADGPGWIEPRADGGFRLHLDARDRVLLSLPEASRMPGRLRCTGLDVDLDPDGSARAGAGAGNGPGGGRWLPTQALGAPPTLWTGADQSFSGGAATVLWHADGDVDGMDLLGPVRLHRAHGPLDWALADGGAWLDPRAPAVELHGGVLARDARGVLRAARARLEEGRIEAGGGVLYAGEGGAARSALLRRAADGSGVAEGDVRLHPADPRIARVTAPRFALDEAGGISTDAGFRVKARGEEGAPLYGEGRNFGTRLVRGERRSRADGDLVLRQGGLEVRGDVLEQTGAQRLELRGEPVRGDFALEDGGAATLTLGRAVWTGRDLVLREDPVLVMPGAALGLAGGELRAAAPVAVRGADGAWTLQRGVTVSGALTGSADEARWDPGRFFEMRAQRGVADLQGTRLDGGRFHAEARRLRLDEVARTLHLEERAYLTWRAADAAGPLELWGNEALLGESAGWATGDARFRSAEGDGEATRIAWESAGEAGWDLDLLGAARLRQGEAEATGSALHHDAALAELLAIGAEGAPARVALDSGGTWTAAWIRYNLVTRLVASGDVVAEAPAPRE